MPRRPLPFGSDTLEIPVYFAKGSGADDPGFQRWKLDHPDWFAAGTWTSAPRPRQRKPIAPDGNQNGTKRLSSAEVAELATSGARRLDPSTLLVSEFQKIAAEVRGNLIKRPFTDDPTAEESNPDLGAIPNTQFKTGEPGLGDGKQRADSGAIVNDADTDGPSSSLQPQNGAQFVVEKGGNRITIERTGDALVAPLDWSPQKAIDFGLQLKKSYEATLRVTGDDAAAALEENEGLALAYKSGAQFDLQQSYNRNGGKGPFRSQFTDAAAYSFGISAAAAGYSLDQAIAGAGIYNLVKSPFTGVDTSGRWWNDPDRVALIGQGYNDYVQGRFGR